MIIMENMTLEKIKSNYKQAVITCAWFVAGGYRQMIIGMVDFIPKFLGDEQGIAEQGIKVKDRGGWADPTSGSVTRTNG